MLRDVHTYGRLADICGGTLRFDVDTAAEAVQAICTNFPAAERIIREDNWNVVRGSLKTGASLDEEAFVGLALGDRDVHIMPEVIGAKDGNGIFKVLVGTALVALSFGGAGFLAAPISQSLLGATTWGNAIGQIGVVMALSGVSQMMAPEQNSDDEEEKKSFLFNGPGQTVGQGNAVPVVYGEVIVGGVLISAGIDAEDLTIVEDEGQIETKDVTPIAPTGADASN